MLLKHYISCFYACLLPYLVLAQATPVTFQKQVDGVNGLFCIDRTSDNTYWVGTFLGKIIQFDANGAVLTGFELKEGDSIRTEIVYDIEHHTGSGFWALYDRSNKNTALDDYLMLGRFDASGQALWQTTVHYGEVKHWAHNRFTTDEQGNAIVVSLRGNPSGSGPNYVQLIKVAPDGTLLWTKELSLPGPAYPRFIKHLSDGSFLLGGNSNISGQQQGFLLRMDGDGQFIWSGRYNHLLFKAFTELPNGDWVLAATSSGPLPQPIVLTRLQNDGTILWANQLDMPTALNWLPDLQITPDSDLVVFNYECNTEAPVPDMFAFRPDGTFKWAMRYDACKNYGVSQGIITPDNGIMGIRYKSSGHLLLKTDLNGQCATCAASAVTIATSPTQDTWNPQLWEIKDKPFPPQSATDFHPFTASVSDYCGREKTAYEIDLQADSLCAFGSVEVKATGTPAADQYKWQFANAAPPVSNIKNPPLLRYDLPGAQPIQLVAQYGFCRDTIRDTVQVLDSPRPLNWPTDSIACIGPTDFSLNATTTGGLNYTWNNGHATSQQKITASGLYIVTISNGFCTISDSIAIKVIETLPLALPGDTTFCSGDTLWLDATTLDADRYQWSDGFKTARRPVTKSDYLTVTVSRAACARSDFISVNFFPSPPLLPADTFFCTGEQLELNVGNSLSGSIWWNGIRGTEKFLATHTGWVYRRIEYQQCNFEDSVFVSEIDCRNGFSYFAPNIFSPESGGPNQYFQIFGDDLQVLDFQVFDRWGNLVFQSTDAAAEWDGFSARQHKIAAAGVYIWQAKIRQRGQEGRISGDVLVVKN